MKLFLGTEKAEDQTVTETEPLTTEAPEEEISIVEENVEQRIIAEQGNGRPYAENDTASGKDSSGKFNIKSEDCCFAYVTTKESVLNVREKADRSSKVTGALQKGRVVIVDAPFNRNSGWETDWVYIKYRDEDSKESYGWVQTAFLTKLDSALTHYFRMYGCEDIFCGENSDRALADEMMKAYYEYKKNTEASLIPTHTDISV